MLDKRALFLLLLYYRSCLCNNVGGPSDVGQRALFFSVIFPTPGVSYALHGHHHAVLSC